MTLRAVVLRCSAPRAGIRIDADIEGLYAGL